jgi:hypothetical protein
MRQATMPIALCTTLRTSTPVPINNISHELKIVTIMGPDNKENTTNMPPRQELSVKKIKQNSHGANKRGATETRDPS